MSIVAMKKVRLVGGINEEKDFLKKLQKSAIIDISKEVSSDIVENLQKGKHDGESRNFELIVNDLKDAQLFLERYAEPKGFAESLFGEKKSVNNEKYLKILKNFDYEKVVSDCRFFENRIVELKTQSEEIVDKLKFFALWESLDFSVEEIKETKQVIIEAGTISLKSDDIDIVPAEFEIISEKNRKKYIVVVYKKEDKNEVSERLKNIDFEKNEFFGYEGKPKEIISKLEEKLRNIEKEKTEIFDRSKKLVNELDNIFLLNDHYFNLDGMEKAKSKIWHTRYIFICEGWIEEGDEKVLQKMISSFKTIEYIEIEKREDEKEPVVLRNKGLFKPFELVTQLYGMPAAKSLDPTILLTPWFAIFFALCLTDAAYGVLLVVFSLFLLRKMKGNKLLWMIFWGGLLTIGTGLITGGVFGDLFRVATPTADAYVNFKGITSFFDKLVWFNPMNPEPRPGSTSPQAMIFFRLALSLGVIQIYIGMITGFVLLWKQKKKLDAILDIGVWLVILSSLLIALFSSTMALDMSLVEGTKPPIPAAAAMPALIVFGVMALIVILFGAREEKNWGFRIFFGILKLIVLSGVFSYMGDIMSYVRLMALGMVTAGIGMAVNTVAFMIGSIKVPVLNWVLFTIIFIGGHIFNLAISSLGAFVHTLRLQYVEFFSKFFQGGGREFIPFAQRNKYIDITD